MDLNQLKIYLVLVEIIARSQQIFTSHHKYAWFFGELTIQFQDSLIHIIKNNIL